MTKSLSGLFLGACAVALALGGCVAGPPPTSGDIEFQELTNLGFTCASGALSKWTVTCVDTRESGTAICEQPVLFPSYNGGQTYIFNIDGYDASGRLCWEGSCPVRAVGGTTAFADCSRQIQSLCP